MKKKMLVVIMLLLATFSIFALEIAVGDGTSETGNMPFKNNYGYSYSQAIYKSSEIGMNGEITSLTYFSNGGGFSNVGNLEIFMGHSNRTGFSGTSDWMPVDSLTSVYTGDATFVGDNLVLTLTTPFEYNGTDNLVIAFHDGMSGWDSYSDKWYKTDTAGENRSLVFYNDSTNPNPASPPTTSYRYTYTYFPNISLNFNVAGAPGAPVNPSPAIDTEMVSLTPTLTWDFGADTTLYDFYLVRADADFGEPTLANQPAGATGSFTVADSVLAEYTDYKWKVVAKNTTEYAMSSAVWTFKTLYTVPLKPNLTYPSNEAVRVAIDVTLNWGDAVGADSYKVYIDRNNPPTSMVASPTASEYQATLDFSTTYYWKVVATNASGDSEASDIRSFTTASNPVKTIPYSEDLDDYNQKHWTETSGVLTSNSTFTSTSGSWTEDDFGNDTSHVNGRCARMEIWSTSSDEWLVSPTITVPNTGADYTIEFDLALTKWNNTSSQTLGVDDTLAVVVSTDNGTTWSKDNIIKVYTSEDAISNTGQHEMIPLGNYSGDIKIGFYARSSVSNEDNNVYIDNFQIRETLVGGEILGGTVSPETSHEYEVYTYSVNYMHTEGTSPVIAKVYIDGTGYDLDLPANPDYTTQTTLTYSTTLPISANHNYYFHINDGTTDFYLPEGAPAVPAAGPVVEAWTHPKSATWNHFYSWKTSLDSSNEVTYNWIEHTAACDTLSGLGDDQEINVPLPFSFPFFDASYDSLSFGTNAILTFIGTSNENPWDNDDLGLAEPDLGTSICFAWDDLEGTGKEAYAEAMIVDGQNAGVLTLQDWKDRSGGTITCQVILFENGNIKVQYKEFNGNPDLASYTIGLAYNTTEYVEYSDAVVSLVPEMALMFTYAPLTNPTATLTPATGGVQINWNAVDNAGRYKVYVATEPGGNWTLATTTTATSYLYETTDTVKFVKVVADSVVIPE